MTKKTCSYCLKEFETKSDNWSDMEGNVFCSKDCRSSFYQERNEELRSLMD